MTPAVNIGSLSLIDDTRAVLLADLSAALTEVFGSVANFDAVAVSDRCIVASDGRNDKQGKASIEFAARKIDDEDNGTPGVKIERWLLVVRAIHHFQRLTKDSLGTPLVTTQEHESWRVASAIARACELALVRGMMNKDGVIMINMETQQRVPQDARKPADYAIDCVFEVHLESYDPLMMSAP